MIFTSESVSAGHPDKVCDQISDAILDAALAQDKDSRVAVETLVKDNQVVLAGEITTNANIDYDQVVRKTILGIGYDKEEYGFNGSTCSITNLLGRQSQDISMGVTESENHEQGAGDQGLMFGYAEDSTDELMPAPIMLSHQLVRQQADLMLNGSIPWLRPDAKSQVSCIYEGNQIVGIDAVDVCAYCSRLDAEAWKCHTVVQSHAGPCFTPPRVVFSELQIQYSISITNITSSFAKEIQPS